MNFTYFNDCQQFLHQSWNGAYANITGRQIPVGPFKENWEVILKATFYAIVWLIAFLGNAVVVIIIIMNQSMRTKTNIFITNLAISDLMIVLCPMWVKPIENLFSNWILGEQLCKLWPFITVTSMTASVFTMTAIACDRFFAVVFPLKSRTTSRNVYAIIAVIWALSIVLGAPLYFAANLHSYTFTDLTEVWCQQTWFVYTCDPELKQLYVKIYWTVVCAVANWIPLLAMTVGYFVIAVIMYRRDKIVPKYAGRVSVQHRSLKKVLRMLFVVLVSFIVCWVPNQFSTLYTIYKGQQWTMPDWYGDVKFITIMLTHLNSACNPIIYGAMNETFRKGFAYVFICWKRKYYYDRYRRSVTSLMHLNSSVTHAPNHVPRTRTQNQESTTLI